jgi:cytochrome P450
MCDEYVHDEVTTMFVAGQETSAVALSWVIALLAQYSEFQEEAAAEIEYVTKDAK